MILFGSHSRRQETMATDTDSEKQQFNAPTERSELAAAWCATQSSLDWWLAYFSLKVGSHPFINQVFVTMPFFLKAFVVLSLNLSFAISPCCGQETSSLPENRSREVVKISKSETLSFNTGVRSILEDSKGSFWFGSWQEGVARFDGEKTTYFSVEDGLDSNQVRNIFEDRSGIIWFDTGNGICSYDGQTFTIRTDRDYNSKSDWKLGPGDIWFGEDHPRVGGKLEGQPGVYRYDGAKLTFLEFPLPKIRSNDGDYMVTGTARGKNGRMWFATYGAVIGYDGRSFTFMNNSSGGFNGEAETDLHVRSIFEDSKGRLWIGNNGIGVLLQEGGKTINFTQKHGLGSQENRRGGPLPGDAKVGTPSLDRVFSIGEDRDGNIWFGLLGTQGYGAWRYDGRALRHFTEKDGLTSKHISVIYRDKQGDLWLGGDGVFKLNGNVFNRMH